MTGTSTLGGTTYTVSGNAGTRERDDHGRDEDRDERRLEQLHDHGARERHLHRDADQERLHLHAGHEVGDGRIGERHGRHLHGDLRRRHDALHRRLREHGLVFVDTSGTAGTWTFAASSTYPTTTPHGGSLLAKFNSYNAASGSQTRVYRTAGFAVASSYTTVSLKFWMYHDTGYSTSNDRIQAQVSTNGTTWTNVGTAISRYASTNGWTQATIDLSAYKGQTVYLGFLGISAYGNNITLDDVTVTAQ